MPGFAGEVLAVQHQRLLEFRWGTDILRLEITPDGAGSILTLRQAFTEQGKGARDAAGWHVCLDALQHHLDGTVPPWTHRERWSEVHPGYVTKFGADASAMGPPET